MNVVYTLGIGIATLASIAFCIGMGGALCAVVVRDWDDNDTAGKLFSVAVFSFGVIIALCSVGCPFLAAGALNKVWGL
jgi:hypothetical protein